MDHAQLNATTGMTLTRACIIIMMSFVVIITSTSVSYRHDCHGHADHDDDDSDACGCLHHARCFFDDQLSSIILFRWCLDAPWNFMRRFAMDYMTPYTDTKQTYKVAGFGPGNFSNYKSRELDN